MPKAQLIQGNEALALGAMYAGANFYAGYPITPSSEVAEICSREMLHRGGMFLQMEDEIASMAAIIGASAAGRKSFTATSGPGFSLMQENLSAATVMEMPVVLINVQRSGPCVGIPTKPAQADMMQLRWGRHGDQNIIALIPSSVKECFELAVEAFNLAEEFRTPVILAPDEAVGHMREDYALPEAGALPVSDRKKPTCSPADYKPYDFTPGAVAPLAAFGGEYVYSTTCVMNSTEGMTSADPANATQRVSQLYSKLEQRRERIIKYKKFYTDDCETLFVAYGSSARAARAVVEEMRARGEKAGLFQIITVWPFPDRELVAHLDGVKNVVVPEVNFDGQIAGEIRKLLPAGVSLTQVNLCNGQVISPELIYSVMS